MPTRLLDQLVISATDRFQDRYGGRPHWIVAAPGRVNLIGEHVDYNDGFVLPMAIDRYTVIAAASAPHDSATLFSVAADDEVTIPLAAPERHPAAGHWSSYVAGVLAGCLARGLRPHGFEAVIESAVPVGSGLSSSASLEVAAATLVEAITGTTLPPVDKAILCQQAEHDYAGVPCGIMDQFASAICHTNHLMLLDCRTLHVEHIPFVDPTVTVLVVNTHVRHEFAGGEYAARRRQCEAVAQKLGLHSLRDATLPQLESRRGQLDYVEFRRARHVVSEIARTLEAVGAIKAGDWPLVGRLLAASHDSLRDDYQVSCRELDLLVELARDIGDAGGVIGARMTGGGFGGCTVNLVHTDKAEDVARQLAQSYRAETGIEPSLLTSRPSRGAHIIHAS